MFQESKGFAQHLDFHPSGVCIGVGTTDKKVKVYDVRMQKLQQLYSSHDGPVTQVKNKLLISILLFKYSNFFRFLFTQAEIIW